MSRPVCKTRCNVTPVCGGQWQSQGQGSFSCGQGSSGYNPGYGYNPAINIPAQVNIIMVSNTLVVSRKNEQNESYQFLY